MRSRNLKPGFFTNEQLAECSFESRILFEGLWCIADRLGRLEDRPKRIKGQLFPYDNVDINKMLGELEIQGLIVRYEVCEKKYIEIPTFLKHQSPSTREVNSVIPGPDGTLPQPRNNKTQPRTCQSIDKAEPKHDLGCTQAPPDILITDIPLTDVPLTKEEAGSGDQELLLTDFTPEETEIVRLFSGVNGLKFDAQKLVQQTRDLRGEYPNVNILSEAKKMALWLDGADGKKKSGKRNLLLFVRNWVERANNTPSPPLRELERKRNGSMSLRNADGTFGDLTPEEEAEQRALEERYSNLDEEGNRIT